LENEVIQVWKSLENDSQISVRTLGHTQPWSAVCGLHLRYTYNNYYYY